MTSGPTLSYVPGVYPRGRARAPAVDGSIASFRRPVFLAVVLAGAAAGFLATGHAAADAAVFSAGPELTHLLRAMAGLKLLFVIAAVLATVWRLGTPASWSRLAVYALTGAAMAAGPGLIWDMAYLKAGALLMHAGLLADVLLLWRDPGTAAQLSLGVGRRVDQAK